METVGGSSSGMIEAIDDVEWDDCAIGGLGGRSAGGEVSCSDKSQSAAASKDVKPLYVQSS